MTAGTLVKLWWLLYTSCWMIECLNRKITCFLVSGKGPIQHSDEYFCVRKQPKHLQLIVRLWVHRAILNLPRWEPQIVPWRVSHRKWIVGNSIILNQDTGRISTERWEAEKEKQRCCWFSMSTEFIWVRGGRVRGHSWLICLKARGDTGQ